jgi:hypothetical protein
METYLIYFALLIVGFILGFVPMWIKSRENYRIIGAGLLILAFLAGYVPMLIKSGGCSNALAAATRQLTLVEAQNNLASAAIDARRGDYESARQATSSFFTALQTEASKEADSSLSQAQKAAAEPVFIRRDEIISLLARNDPAATEQLSDLYVSFRELVGK